MKKFNKFSPEVRERAVRLVQEHRAEYPSLWAAIESITSKIGCVPASAHAIYHRSNERGARVQTFTGARIEPAYASQCAGADLCAFGTMRPRQTRIWHT